MRRARQWAGWCGFDEQRWAEHRFEVVVAGNMAKFGQWQLRDFLADTGSRVLVEASSRDMVWRIGLADDERAGSPERGPGLNLLGLALDHPETIEETAELVNRAGGEGIAVPADHLVPHEVRALTDRIRAAACPRRRSCSASAWVSRHSRHRTANSARLRANDARAPVRVQVQQSQKTNEEVRLIIQAYFEQR
jgi:hypothetical protein